MTRNHILTVDNEEDILDVLEGIFSPTYTVSRAICAKDALNILSTETIQLIISDVVMPEMDGFEFCRLIKSTIEYSHIPIVLLTGKDELDSKIEGLETGADAYIEKPFSVQHLTAQVNSLIANRNLVKRSFVKNPLSHIKSLAISKADSQFMDNVSNIIHKNIDNTALNVDFIANTLNMTRMTLYRKILASTDLTPSEFINVTRLKKAIVLMTENQHKLFEIALMVGYADQSSFTRSFQAQYGMPPREYIKTLKEDTQL